MEKNNRSNKGRIFLKIILVVLLVWALMPNPYGYYILLRWIACPIFAYLALLAYERQNVSWTWIFGVLAGIYNPIFSVHLGREIWSIVNVFSIVFLIVHAIKSKRLKDNSQQDIIPKEKPGLIKDGLDHIQELKKPQVRILMGNYDDEISETIFEFIELSFENNYEIEFFISNDGREILELADKESIDIFILVINNIGNKNDFEQRLKDNLQLITQIQTIYGEPVIALCGGIDDAWVIERTKISADFFFFLPQLDWDGFKDAIEMILDFDKPSPKKEKKGISTASKKCPKCGKKMLVRNGQNGKFYCCSGYPECHFFTRLG